MFIPSIPRNMRTSAKERVHQIRITAVTGGDLLCPASTVNSLVSREEGESDESLRPGHSVFFVLPRHCASREKNGNHKLSEGFYAGIKEWPAERRNCVTAIHGIEHSLGTKQGR